MRFWVSASLAVVLGAAAAAQSPARKPTSSAKHRKVNELTLAGLRPGRDLVTLAVQLYKQPDLKNPGDGAQLGWSDSCRKQSLTLDTDAEKKIQVARATEARWLIGDCVPVPPGPWKTGRGLRVWDPARRVVELYGEPDSRSPSTKDGQQLELLYYAFDWAGADVPQVMEVLCTVAKNGAPARVVEITLAAPSL